MSRDTCVHFSISTNFSQQNRQKNMKTCGRQTAKSFPNKQDRRLAIVRCCCVQLRRDGRRYDSLIPLTSLFHLAFKARTLDVLSLSSRKIQFLYVTPRPRSHNNRKILIIHRHVLSELIIAAVN